MNHPLTLQEIRREPAKLDRRPFGGFIFDGIDHNAVGSPMSTIEMTAAQCPFCSEVHRMAAWILRRNGFRRCSCGAMLIKGGGAYRRKDAKVLS